MPVESTKKTYRVNPYPEPKTWRPSTGVFESVPPSNSFSGMSLESKPVPVQSGVAKIVPVQTAPMPEPSFKPIKGGTRKCKYPATYAGLHIWFKNEFEKLGWIVLAKHKGYHDKVETYKHSVKRLHEKLECKVRDTKDHDRKQDLLIMLNDVNTLISHIKNNL